MEKENLKFVSIKHAAEMIGVSNSTIRRLIDRGNFPQPFNITESRIGLLEGEVRQWMKETYEKGQAANDN